MAGMVPEDVYALNEVSDPRISPNGRTVAYVVKRVDRDANEYRSAIWVSPLDGALPAHPFTAGERTDAAPRWAPDGTRLAFVSNREGEKQLYVIPASGGEARRLTDLPEDVEDPVWSPAGDRIAFVSRVADPAYREEDGRRRPPRRISRLQYKLDGVGWTCDRRAHLFTVRADGSEAPVQLTSGDFEHGGPTWSPDGSRIAFVSARQEDWDLAPIDDVYLIDAVGGQPRQLTGGDGWCSAPSWSPDGRLIAYRYSPGRFDYPRHTQIGVVDAATGERHLLTTSLDRNCSPYLCQREPLWDGGERVVFALEDQGSTHLYSASADGAGRPELVVGGEMTVTGFDFVARQLVHTAMTATSLPELYAADQRLTDVGRPFVETRELVKPEHFTAVSPDGSEVDAWIMRPVGVTSRQRTPVLLYIHGGPFTQDGHRFLDELQVYAGAGYAVLLSNPRGSAGYGESWARAIRPRNGGPGWGSLDYEDLMAVVDEALQRFDFCDPDRLGVLGASYGGFMTSWIVGHTNRFRAACSERAPSNFLSDHGSADLGWLFKGIFGAFVFEDPEGYLRVSPLTYAQNVQTPLLILHSEDDLRCDVEQAEEFFTILRLLKRDVEFVRFPAEGHELSRSGSPIHRVMRFEVILDWFGRYLADPEQPEIGETEIGETHMHRRC